MTEFVPSILVSFLHFRASFPLCGVHTRSLARHACPGGLPCDNHNRLPWVEPRVKEKVRQTKRQVPGAGCQAPSARCQVSGARRRVPRVRGVIPSEARNLALRVGSQAAFRFQGLVASACFLPSAFCLLLLRSVLPGISDHSEEVLRPCCRRHFAAGAYDVEPSAGSVATS